MKKLQIIIAIIVGLMAIGGTGWKFYDCKASKAEFQEYVSMNDTMWLENYRRDLQKRIWDIQREYPHNYQNMTEYKRLVEELGLIEIKIQAYYQGKGKG